MRPEALSLRSVRRAWTAGKYRWRTRLRVILPSRLSRFAPKGAGDCGNHEWYTATERELHCYHCTAHRET